MLNPRRKFPLISPVDNKCTEFYGFLSVLNEEYKIYIILNDVENLEGLKLLGEWRFLHILNESKCHLENHLKRSTNLVGFLLEVQSHLEKYLCSMEESPLTKLPPAYYGNLFMQLEDFGWERLKYINGDWNKIHIEGVDDGRRSHILQVTVPPNYPGKPMICSADLPSSEVIWPENTIQAAYQEFITKLEAFQSFWNCMDEIDHKVWVLQPTDCDRQTCRRTIAVAPSITLQIKVDPYNPTAVPECHFFGPEKSVGPLRELFHSNLDHWDAETSLLTNLQSVLEMSFPLKCNTKKEELHLECGICYSDSMNGKLPEIMCEETHCLQQFHHSCLYEWLKSIPTTQYSFNVLFGECPYCSQQITCRNLSSEKG